MVLSYKTQKVSIYAMVKDAKGEYQEAQGVGAISWNLHITENKNEVQGITIEIPDQVISEIEMIFYDHDGEQTIKTSVELKNAQASSKSINLNQALLPNSVEVREETTVYFSADPSSIF